jgi:4-hydroxybenzoate polyprenyltransferase
VSDAAGLGGAPVPDAPAGNWVDRLAPPRSRPFLRLARADRPIGWWLLLLPCWWSTALATEVSGGGLPSPILLALFFLGAVAMRGAGSTYNDIVDRDLDKRVARTRDRPIASRQVSVTGAFAFVALQCLIGLFVLVTIRPLDPFVIGLGFAAMIPVLAYPFMKRITSWPQAVLGLAFSWGALMGWAAVTGSLAAPALLLYAGTVLWVMGYDTIYAVQDVEDDAIAGIRSTALLFGPRTKTAVGVFYGLACLLMFGALWKAGAGPIALAGLAAFAAHLASQVWRLDPRDGVAALRLFRANRDAGLLLFAGLAASSVAA